MRLQKVYFTSYMINHFLNSDVIWLKSVDSTNEEIKRRIHEFSKPTWVIAKNQLRGKEEMVIVGSVMMELFWLCNIFSKG